MGTSGKEQEFLKLTFLMKERNHGLKCIENMYSLYY